MNHLTEETQTIVDKMTRSQLINFSTYVLGKYNYQDRTEKHAIALRGFFIAWLTNTECLELSTYLLNKANSLV